MNKTGKLELTWVGKYELKKTENRILIEDISKSNAKNDPNTENMLIKGDNLIALKALENKYSGKIKFVYIDPPFNASAREDNKGNKLPYEDSWEHSVWLNMMKDRLSLIHNLLSEEGVIFVNLDDSESAYMKVLLDEIFGRKNYLNEIIVATNKSFGFKSTTNSIFKQANKLFFYAKNVEKFAINADAMYVEKGYDKQYRFIFENVHLPENEWTWRNIQDIVAENMGFANPREANNKNREKFEQEVANYALMNADKIFRTASVSGGALAKRRETIILSKNNKKTIIRHPGDDMDYMFIGGERVLYYKERLKMIDGVLLPAEILTDIWMDISVEGLASEGGVNFPKGKKPEKLIRRCIELTTQPGDIILDSFLGSGTTTAVAHKMGRKWIGIELGEHAYTHCKIRMDNVINGEQSGISKEVGWTGGGGYKFYELAPSLLEKHPILPIYQVNNNYTFEMLCEAICKLEGFKYEPMGEMHGKSSETRYIHISRDYISGEYIQNIVKELDENHSVLIYGTKIQSDLKLPENIEVKRIPKDLLKKYDFESEVR